MTNCKRRESIWFLIILIALSALSPARAASPPPFVAKLVTADIVLSSDGSATEKLHFEILANNDASASIVGQTSVPYEATLESVEIVDAHTLKPDGSSIPVSTNAIFDQVPPALAQAPMISNLRNKLILFPQFSAGDVAVYTIIKTIKTPLIRNAFWYGDAFNRAVAYDDVRETITSPKTLPLFVVSHDIDYSKSEAGSNVVYAWHYSQTVPTPPQIKLVSPLDSEPHFFATTFKDYAELGNAYAALAESKMDPTPSIATLANQITHGIDDQTSQVKAMYEWVSKHIRYVAIELGAGSFVPHNPDDVVASGYGDCKDHVVLLGALLRAKGIASQGLLVNSTNEYTLPSVATFATLNHEITWVPQFNLYLDSSIGTAPFGVLPLQEYGKPVIRVSLSGSSTDRLPFVPVDAITVTTKTDERLDAAGNLVGGTTTTASGPYSVLLREMGLGIQSIGGEAAAAQQLARLGYAGATGNFDVGQPGELAPSYSISSTFVAPGWNSLFTSSPTFFIPGGLRLLGYSGDGPMGPFAAGELKDSEPVGCFSAHEIEDLSFHLPPGRKLASIPSDTVVETSYIRFVAHWTLQDTTISVHRDFRSTITDAICSSDIRRQNAAALKSISENYSTVLSFAN